MQEEKFQELIKQALLLETCEINNFINNIEDCEIQGKIRYLLEDNERITNFFQDSISINNLFDIEKIQELQTGARIKQFLIIKLIAKGGMGSVYLAFDEKLKRNVAIKTIRNEYLKNKTTKKRFAQEAQILSQINHPNICQIYDYIDYEDGNLLVLEFVKGETLSNASIKKENILNILIQIIVALQLAHKNNIIHRDLKPENIMITEDNQVKILDFGIAKSQSLKTIKSSKNTTKDTNHPQNLTQQGLLLGTLSYMSPEQMHGKNLTTASDIYAFGIIMHELLTSDSVYCATTFESLSKEVKNAEVTISRKIKKDYAKLITQLIAINPNNRPTAKEVLKILKTIENRPRKRKLFAVIFLFSVVLFALSMLVVWQQYNAQSEKQRIQFISQTENKISNVNNQLNFIYTKPKHNIEKELDQLNEQKNKLINAIQKNKNLTNATKNQLIGQSYYAYEDYHKAMLFLEKAWTQGIRTTDLAFQIAYTYLDEFNKINLFLPSRNDSSKDKELETTKKYQMLKEKMNYYSNYYTSHAESSNWRIEMYTNFYNKNFQEALDVVDLEKIKLNADYKTLNFIGLIYLNMMFDAEKQDKPQLAKKYFHHAISILKIAVEFARSHPKSYTDICDIVTYRIGSAVLNARDVEEEITTIAKSYCNSAVEIYTKNKKYYRRLTSFYSSYGEYKLLNGKDGEMELREASRWLDKTINFQQNKDDLVESFVYGDKAFIYDLLAEQLLIKGSNPLKTVSAALSAYKKSLDIEISEITRVTGNMFYSYMIAMKYKTAQGDIPLDLMQEADELYTKQYNSAYKRTDLYGNLHSNYGDLQKIIANAYLLHDKNPQEWTDKAINSYTISLKEAKKMMPYPLGGKVIVKTIQAQYDFQHDIVIDKQLKEIEMLLQQAEKVGAKLAWIQLAKANFLSLKLARDIKTNKTIEDLSKLIETINQTYQKAIRMKTTDLDSHLSYAKFLHLLAIIKTKKAKFYSKKALNEIQKILKIIPQHFEALKIQKEIMLTKTFQ